MTPWDGHAPSSSPTPLPLTTTTTPPGAVLTSGTRAGGGVTSTYDAADRLERRRFGGLGLPEVRIDIGWTDDNQRRSLNYYRDHAGTQQVVEGVFHFDAHDRPFIIAYYNAADVNFEKLIFDYDALGRLRTEDRFAKTAAGAVDAPFTYSTAYAYDQTDQLEREGSTAVTYDPGYNRTGAGIVLGPGNRLERDGRWKYGYDEEGNLIRKDRLLANGQLAGYGSWTYRYDHANRLLSAQEWTATPGASPTIKEVDYVYDAFGNRAERRFRITATGAVRVSRFAYDGGDVWADLDGANEVQARYVRGDGADELFARVDGAGGPVHWYVTDRQGSVLSVVSSTGALEKRLRYRLLSGEVERCPSRKCHPGSPGQGRPVGNAR